jgi:hypothetical protein
MNKLNLIKMRIPCSLVRLAVCGGEIKSEQARDEHLKPQNVKKKFFLYERER